MRPFVKNKKSILGPAFVLPMCRCPVLYYRSREAVNTVAACINYRRWQYGSDTRMPGVLSQASTALTRNFSHIDQIDHDLDNLDPSL